MKNSVVTGIEPTTSVLFDKRRSRWDNQAPEFELIDVFHLKVKPEK